MMKPKIVIIGAGAAGIAAAAKLLQNGFNDLVILEAEDRIGGRINSVRFGEGLVDLGAQWCHGQEDNIVYNTVKDLNLLSPSLHSYDEFALYESSGRLVSKKLSDKLVEIAFNIAFDSESLGSANGSFGDYFINRYNKVIKQEFSDNADDYKVAKEVTEWFHKLIICLDSAPTWFDVSAKRSPFYKHCEGNNYLNWRDTGYIKILHVLMKTYPDPTYALPFEKKIVFKKVVSKILWKNGSVIINCADDTTYEADHVIVTVSLGVLKQSYKSLFYPELPLAKENAIKYLGFGSLIKVFLSFPDQWWPSHCTDFNFLWSKDDHEDILNDFPNGPVYNGRSWLEGIIGFYAVDNHPKVLMVWIVGNHIQELENLPEDILMEGCMFLLKKYVGNKYNISQPNNIIRSDWKSNPYFNGAYSYQSIASEKHNALPKDLAEPLSVANKDVVLFAGEATHPHYYSTVHGAIETGFREASRIINAYSDHDERVKSKL